MLILLIIDKIVSFILFLITIIIGMIVGVFRSLIYYPLKFIVYFFYAIIKEKFMHIFLLEKTRMMFVDIIKIFWRGEWDI
jgi:hypothetical protein